MSKESAGQMKSSSGIEVMYVYLHSGVPEFISSYEQRTQK